MAVATAARVRLADRRAAAAVTMTGVGDESAATGSSCSTRVRRVLAASGSVRSTRSGGPPGGGASPLLLLGAPARPGSGESSLLLGAKALPEARLESRGATDCRLEVAALLYPLRELARANQRAAGRRGGAARGGHDLGPRGGATRAAFYAGALRRLGRRPRWGIDSREPLLQCCDPL